MEATTFYANGVSLTYLMILKAIGEMEALLTSGKSNLSIFMGYADATITISIPSQVCCFEGKENPVDKITIPG